jgi:transposase-like protein
MMAKKTAASYSPEVRERAVRMVLDGAGEHGSQWAAIGSIAAKIGCTASRKATPEASANAKGGKGGKTLRRWVRQAERDRGKRAGPMTEERDRIKALERENRELRQANEILRKASAYSALAELDRRSKP